MQQVSFRRMDEGNAADYELLNKLADDFVKDLPNRILAELQNLEQSLASYQINRLEHSLQSATRAERDGAYIEMIVAALIHNLAPMNYLQLAATIIRPRVRSKISWII